MRQLLCFLALSTTLAVGTIAPADLRGTVINGTTKKPAAGDEVVLLTLTADGMNESAYAKTDRSGHFRLPVSDPQASHLVRVVHQGVTYHKPVEADLKAVMVEVYDVADRLDGVSAIMDVQRFEATGDRLEVKQLITVRNDLRPPRTLLNDRPFEIQLPAAAQVQSGLVQVEEAPPLKQRPVASDEQGHYYFPFPIRPGDTRFAVVYKVPYSGEAVIETRLRNPGERFVVMLPKSMTFEPKTAGIFRPMPGSTPDTVLGTSPVMPGQALGFRISGTGMLEELQGRRQKAQAREETQKSGPGGGLGRPIEAPDPLQEYRWPILAVLAGFTVMGAVYVAQMTKHLHQGNYHPRRASSRLTPPTRVRKNGRRRRRIRV